MCQIFFCPNVIMEIVQIGPCWFFLIIYYIKSYIKKFQVLPLVKILLEYVLKVLAIHNGWPRLLFQQ